MDSANAFRASHRYVFSSSVHFSLRMEPCLFIYDMNQPTTKNPVTPMFTGLSKTPRVGLEPTTTR